VLLVWALDRLTRQGIRALLGLIERFDQAGVRIVSLREPWLDTLGQTRDLVLAVLAWVAQMESDRHAERVRAGLDKRRAAGLPVGRQPGAVDKAPRKRSGYVKRWEATRER
jgi:DNA invertase Pin-like site-specific DNA recombinase